MDARVRAEAKATKTATTSKRRKERNVPAGEAMLGLAVDERRGEGKALREAVAREAHAGWKARPDRRDTIELLHESNAGRIPPLIPIRYGRMMQSPFTFFRGAACIMAADLATTAISGLRVQACGDAHLSNFGGFATPERNIVFDINDLDETLPAPWEWANCDSMRGCLARPRRLRTPQRQREGSRHLRRRISWHRCAKYLAPPVRLAPCGRHRTMDQTNSKSWATHHRL
jgi:hypothetical protein